MFDWHRLLQQRPRLSQQIIDYLFRLIVSLLVLLLLMAIITDDALQDHMQYGDLHVNSINCFLLCECCRFITAADDQQPVAFQVGLNQTNCFAATTTTTTTVIDPFCFSPESLIQLPVDFATTARGCSS